MPSAPPPDHLVIGVDIGGTKVAAGLVDPSGEILSHARNPMAGSNGPARGLASVTQAIDAASAQTISKTGVRTLSGIGICCPGPLDPNTGVVINPPNLPCWRIPDVD